MRPYNQGMSEPHFITVPFDFHRFLFHGEAMWKEGVEVLEDHMRAVGRRMALERERRILEALFGPLDDAPSADTPHVVDA